MTRNLLYININLKQIIIREKKITVYVVSANDKDVNFATVTRSNEAKELLAKFGVEVEVEKVKKTVTID